MEPGYLVEFFDQRHILCGIVLELKGERLHVLAQTNREMTLARKRVLHACPSPLSPQLPRQQLLNYLEETARKREDLKESIKLEELWDLLAQENQALSAREMADLWFGKTDADQVAALERALLADRFLFKFKDELWVPNPPEMVARLQENFQREQERLQEMEDAAVWLRAVWEREKTPEPKCAPYLVDLLRQMAVFGPEAQDYAQDPGQKPDEFSVFGFRFSVCQRSASLCFLVTLVSLRLNLPLFPFFPYLLVSTG